MISLLFYGFICCERMLIDVILLFRLRFCCYYYIDFNNNMLFDDFGCLWIRLVLFVIGWREMNYLRLLFIIRLEFVVCVM